MNKAEIIKIMKQYDFINNTKESFAKKYNISSKTVSNYIKEFDIKCKKSGVIVNRNRDSFGKFTYTITGISDSDNCEAIDGNNFESYNQIFRLSSTNNQHLIMKPLIDVDL
jgi:hypothetical protein